MKRAILLATLAVSLAFGSGRAFAFPTGPCAPGTDHRAASGVSQVQLFLLLLPALVSPIV